MAKSNIPVLVRNHLLRDLETDRPNPSTWDKWINSKSWEYGQEEDDVRKFLTLQLEVMDYHVGIAAAPIAQKIAAALGATRMEAISVLRDGMKATKVVAVRILNGGDGPKVAEVEVPDWRERRGSATEVLKLWGSYAPQVIRVEHDILNELANLSEEELLSRRQKLIAESSPTGIEYSVVEDGDDDGA